MKLRILIAVAAVVTLPISAIAQPAKVESNQSVATVDTENNASGQSETGNTNQPTGLVERVTADPLMALLTFGLLLFAGWQTIISRTTARQELRAYISVKVASGMRDGLNLTAVVKFANVGQTPAKEVRMGAKILLCEKGRMKEVPRWQFAEVSAPGVVWGPGLELAPLTARRKLTDEEAKKLLHDKTVNAVLVGAAEYIDVFGKRRRTDFSYVLDMNSGEVTPHDFGGNDAT